ncbi:MAG TPA: cysteine--tRNA ligase [Gemmatimonadales bacterium]|nr:cysteine--tRNA ligase [Gemmatimonadales bacterium]
MTLRLFNTLTRRVEDFAPLAPPRVTLYTCGPTVWNYAHIGNFRTFVFEDVLRRYLEYSGYEVTHVMNLTDVDDRTIAAANRAGHSLAAHTAPYVEAFFADRDYLRLAPATHYPRATTHIPHMVALVERLLERGVAYRGDDGSVYFAIDKFPTYGRLSRVERRDLKAGARVSSDEYAKEDARDFVLWKAAKPEDEQAGAAWAAPFGRGRPGWHLECSAMAQHYLGETLDIHAGGVDLIFPHHEDEIAQSEAATGRPFVRCWLHGEFLLVDDTKMSKRYGNFVTVRDLRDDGRDPTALRYLFGNTHYRKQLNFTRDALEAAAAGAARLGELRQRLVRAHGQGAAAAGSGALAQLADALEQEFKAAMDDDLDAPRAVAALMNFVRDANRALDALSVGRDELSRALAAFDRASGVLQVVPAAAAVGRVEAPTAPPQEAVRIAPPGPGEDIGTWARRIAEARARARGRRDWQAADEARRLLAEHGFEVRDTKDGAVELRPLAAKPHPA